jgi:hypothetical protein
MQAYARGLFGLAAILNLSVGLAVLAAPAAAMAFAGVGPVPASAVVLTYFAGAMIGLFGYGYLRIALDPATFRPLVHIGAMGKLLAVVCAVLPWAMGRDGPRLMQVLAPDAVFALLFLDYLRRTAKKA